MIEQNLEEGDRLTPKMRQDMARLSAELVKTYEDAYNKKRKNFGDEFKRYQYKEDEIAELLGDTPNVTTDATLPNVDYQAPIQPEEFNAFGIDAEAFMRGPDGYLANPEVPTYIFPVQ